MLGTSTDMIFSTRTHGVLDYSSVVLLFVLPRVTGWSRTVTRLLTAAALGTLVYSLLTRYELGVVKVVPMPAHLALDGGSGLTLCAAAKLLRDEPPSVRLALLGLGLFEITASLTTETAPRAEQA